MRSTAVFVLIAVAALAAGCSTSSVAARAGTCLAPIQSTAGQSGSTPSTSRSSEAAATSTAAPAAASTPPGGLPSGTGVVSSDQVVALPASHFACLDGTGDVTLAGLPGPALISLWGSWCAPCRAELPTIEAFASAASGRVAVLGVDTADEASAGRSMVADFHLTFPQVEDPDTALIKGIGAPQAIPMLLLVRDGTVVLRYSSNQLDEATLDRIVAEYLGVEVEFH